MIAKLSRGFVLVGAMGALALCGPAAAAVPLAPISAVPISEHPIS